MITVDFWSDFACPFCYIAERRLKNVVKKLGLEGEVRYKMHAFELDPSASKDYQGPTADLMANKYGMTLDQANDRIAMINKMAHNEGITGFDDSRTQVVNSMDAHCLVKYAQAQRDDKKTDQLIERIFKAYFVDFENIADREVLLSIANEFGYDEDKVRHILETEQYKMLVQQDELELVSAGLSSVPFFVIVGKGVAGAQPHEVFEDLLKEAAQIEGVKTKAPTEPQSGMSCDIHGCHLD